MASIPDSRSPIPLEHDTCSDWDEAFIAADGHPIEIVPGLELSTVHNGRSLHILGFCPKEFLIIPKSFANLPPDRPTVKEYQ